ncbi:hypothetical protein J27TS8_27530 [Robertmurraya siralis]|jgi:hypothetical protein|uniref:Uncharacterized protein n=1 Tax=Robertmurraya siralis TaxID=77777 RepID=A0A919WIP8_9BACI|nr:hypothetical protein [Robertmurraya siralis]GIN62760.1 hypothetical protein J27TS8_27530 [Robertmurraya siralis]
MADAFIYMYIVGAGTALGVATVGLITWKIITRNQKPKLKKKRGIV